MQEEFGLTYLFIAHNLSVVEHFSNRVAVMYLGRIVELSASKALFAQPLHPYTQALISAVPQPDPSFKMNRVRLEGGVPSPANPPSSCHFHPRCRFAKDICAHEVPALREVSSNHWAACHFSEELDLQGVSEFTMKPPQPKPVSVRAAP